MINVGQTTIEFYRNRVAKATMETEFCNPFDKGWKSNWLNHLHLRHSYDFWTLLIPMPARPLRSLSDDYF